MSEQPEDSGHDKPGAATVIDVTPDPAPARAEWIRRGVMWLPAIVAIVLLAAAPFWAPPLAALLPWAPAKSVDPSVVAALDRLVQQLGTLTDHEAALEQQMARLETRLSGAASSGAQLEQAAAMRLLADRIGLLEQRPSAPAPADTAPLAAELAAVAGELRQIGERLGALETRAAAPAVVAVPVAPSVPAAERTDQALLLALGRVREALAAARPFGGELATLERLGRGRPEVTAALPALAAAAPNGVPATATLARRFEQEVAPAVIRAAALPESDSWSDRVLGRLGSLVTIRRVGDSGIASHDPVEAALARAGTALAAGDLAAAMAAVESLPERTQAPARGWLDLARMRLNAAQAVTKLDDALAARLAADAAAEPAPER